MTKWLAVFLLLGTASAAFALEDTPQNRIQQVDRYLASVPTQELMADMMTKMAKGMPEGQREPFLSMMTQHLDFNAIKKAQRDAMVKIFTAGELGALADFHASPAGKSAMRKMGDYMAELMPVMMTEVMKAQTNIQREMSQPPKQ